MRNENIWKIASVGCAMAIALIHPSVEAGSQSAGLNLRRHLSGSQTSRTLSIVDPLEVDDDTVDASASASSEALSSMVQTHGISEAAKATLASTSSNKTSSESSPSTSNHEKLDAKGNSNSTNVTTTVGNKSIIRSINNTSTTVTHNTSSDFRVESKTTNSTRNVTTSENNVGKSTLNPEKAENPGEHLLNFTKALPQSYNYNDDDDNFASIMSSMVSPLNPVIDDLSELLDDEVPQINRTRSVIPIEKEPPSHWPFDVLGIFVVAAIILFATTAYKNYKRRTGYSTVPSTS